MVCWPLNHDFPEFMIIRNLNQDTDMYPWTDRHYWKEQIESKYLSTRVIQGFPGQLFSNSENLDGSVFDICLISRLFITFSNSKQFNSKVRIKVTWKLIPEIECNVKQLTVLLLACRLYQLHSFISVIKSWVENPRIRSRAICSATKGQFTRTKVTLKLGPIPRFELTSS